jgi:glycine hydroxymethyltransferase
LTTIQLNAAENIISKNILYPLTSHFSSKTAEGTPGKRYHLGCEVVDRMELLGEKRLSRLFNSEKVWLQPLSGSVANLVVIQSIFENQLSDPMNVRIMAMKLDHGGHLSHSTPFNLTGRIFKNSKFYTVNKDTFLIDYDQIYEEAMNYKPQLLICGASSYPREIDFKRFGEIADACGAILLSDISHIFGLVATGLHLSPFEHSSFITTSSYKAGGPHGGLIIAGKKSTAEQREKISRYIFPVIQSTPDFGSIASKTAFFREMSTTKYIETQKNIVKNSRALSKHLTDLGYHILTGGTDNHMVLIDVLKSIGITGRAASTRLSECGIYCNRNLIPYDTQNANNCSGIRLGTNTISRIGMTEKDMKGLALLINDILTTDPVQENIAAMKSQVEAIMSDFNQNLSQFF